MLPISVVEITVPAFTRAAVTLIFAVAFSIGFFRGLIDGGNFTTVVGMVMAFWFGSRSEVRRATDTGGTNASSNSSPNK